MNHTINTARTAAVALDVYWQPITPETPRGVRMLLISKPSGIAQVSTVLAHEAFFTHWAALPRWPVSAHCADQAKPMPMITHEQHIALREGAPYDNARFEALCREHEIWGTPQSALAAVFWRAAPTAKKKLTSAQDFDICGHLAASLKCWHRLSKAEAEELVALFFRAASNGGAP